MYKDHLDKGLSNRKQLSFHFETTHNLKRFFLILLKIKKEAIANNGEASVSNDKMINRDEEMKQANTPMHSFYVSRGVRRPFLTYAVANSDFGLK